MFIPQFWDVLFSAENTKALADGLVEAIPLVLTGLFTILVSWVTTIFTDRRRRIEAREAASEAAKVRLEEREHLESREDRLNWREDLRTSGLRLSVAAQEATDDIAHLFHLRFVEPDEHFGVDSERYRVQTRLDSARRILTEEVDAMSVYGPESVKVAAKELGLAVASFASYTDFGGNASLMDSFKDQSTTALETYLDSLRSHLRVGD